MMEAQASEMEGIWQRLCERYPLLERAIVYTLGADYSETLPLFFGLFLSSLDQVSQSPCCFVLPRRGQMARLASTIYGLSVFRREFPSLARAYAEQSFPVGQRVRVFPSREVYTFDGFWGTDLPNNFRLRTLDGNGSRSFPVKDVLRLAQTSKTRPQGKLSTKIRDAEQTALDNVIGVPTYGNLNLFKNRVLCLDEQAGFSEFADEHYLGREGEEQVTTMNELLPLGKLRNSRTGTGPVFENWSTRYPLAEPLVAVTSSCERLAEYCLSVEPWTKVVVVNGLRSLSNRQAYDEIASCQRIVLFADHDDDERMREIESRGCRFWVVGDVEFAPSAEEDLESTVNNGAFGSVVRRARNLTKLRIEPSHCTDKNLEAAALNLEDLREAVDAEAEHNPTGKLGRLVHRSWRLLNEASGFCCAPTAVEGARIALELKTLQAELDSQSMWLDAAALAKLRQMVAALQEFYDVKSTLGAAKGDSLRSALTTRFGKPTAVVVRSETQRQSLEQWLRGKHADVSVHTIGTLGDEATFDFLVVTSWLGGDAFRKLAGRLIAPNIVALCYAFENRWLQQCQRRIMQRPVLSSLSNEEKAAVVGGTATKIQWPQHMTVSEPEPTESKAMDFDVWTYEQRLKATRKGGANADVATQGFVPAKYVSFVGDGYAHLTRWHKVPVATGLLASRPGKGSSLPERLVDDLTAGDLVVFPEGGGKAVIASVADGIIGPEAASLRARCRLWREVLQASGMTPESFHARAKDFGFSRHLLTIRNWYYDEAQIGPGDRDDLDLIAIVMESTELEKAAGEIWEKMTLLRSNHISAGSVLRDAVLSQLQNALAGIGESGSRIEIPNLGAAWVVQVDLVAPKFEDESRNRVDRLLWDNELT